MSTAEVLPISQERLDQKALTMADRARTITVTDQVTHDLACEMLLGIKDLRAEAEKHHRPMIDAAHKAHKEALAALARIDGPLKEAEGVLKPRIASWEAEQRRIREECERKAREEAERLAAEALEVQIEQAEAEGATAAEVQAIIEQPVPIVQPRIAPTFQPTSGISMAANWKAEVVNLNLLVAAVARGQAPVTLLQANATALGQFARATRGSQPVPGVRFFNEPVLRAGRR